jgi:biopolymer transport protein ExbD
MLISDLSQQELEDLELALAIEAVEDKPDPKLRRPILNIHQDGRIVVKRDTLFDPADGNTDRSQVASYLQSMAALSPVDEEGFPENPILIRADENTPFRELQKIMEMCAAKDIRIWKIEIAAKVLKKDE